MSVVIRMSRGGTKKKPVFTIVAADKTACRDGRFLEKLGQYDPNAEDGKKVSLQLEKLNSWVQKGAVMSETVGHLVKAASKLS